ncbi:PorT family protein [Ornithobacterium rhinotracheale]|uniref:PorT family protein n=1 Tax=Ornithobacterium rhinotracheale TaxID=28251 RepID=A0A3R5WZP1_ORNRH|nr:porin family protein [Ornithobacterium rhinotracheale]QAR30864.1 PorT family protein [Ornithobacterium rhinotracheale]
MKKIISLAILFSTLGLNAQWKTNYGREDFFVEHDEQRLSWGYFVSLNQFDFKITPRYDYGTDRSDVAKGETYIANGASTIPLQVTEKGRASINENGKFLVTVDSKMGFSAGLMGRLKVNDYVDLWVQPGIHFAERTLHFDNIKVDEEIDVLKPDTEEPNMERYTVTKDALERNIKSSYVDIPFMIEFHGERWFNTRPYVQVGLGYAVNLQSQESNTDDNYGGIFRTKTHNFNWQAEMGINIYFRRFKLTPAVKGIFFLNNELVPDNPGTPNIWANTMSSLKTRALVFSLKFE